MNKVKTLDENYSTTRRLVKADPAVIADLIKKAAEPEDQFEIQVFLPAGENRQGEGGLRTKGSFKIGGLISTPVTPHASHLTVEGLSPDTKRLLTIVTVVYNGEQYLEETILSVINQTYDNVEYIIVDGGSTDGTLDIIKKYEHAIDYWVSEEDKGIYDAMNKGIDLASGDWVIFMNAGDDFITDNILSMVNLFEEKVICNYGYTKWKAGKKSRRINSPYLLRLPDHQTMFVKLSWIKNNKFDTKFKICADLDMKMKIHKKGGFACLGLEVCAAQEGGVSQSYINISQINNEMKIIHKKYFYLNFPFYVFEFVWVFLRKLKRNFFRV